LAQQHKTSADNCGGTVYRNPVRQEKSRDGF
jgi:hypothetical protein